MKKIPSRQLGRNGPHVSCIGFGTMGIGAFYGSTDEGEASKALTHAADRGMTFWDCSDIYGNTEEVLGRWFTETSRRNEIFLATKFGARDPDIPPFTTGQPISTPSHIRRSVQRSLDKLKTERIDLYYQHRVDPSVPIEIVIETLREFVDKGVIGYLGLSECSKETLQRACAVPGIGSKIIAVQMEYSPWSLDIEKDGFVEVARSLGVAIVAYSPLCRGLVTGKFRSPKDFEEGDIRLFLPRFSEENFPKSLILADRFKAIADTYGEGVTPSQICLAWISAENPDFFPIPGCRTAARIEDNAKGAEVVLKPEDIREIRRLAEEADNVGGPRYPEYMIKSLSGNCISLDEWKPDQEGAESNEISGLGNESTSSIRQGTSQVVACDDGRIE